MFQLALGVDFGESLSLRLHAYASSTPFYIIVPILYFSLIIIVGNWVLFNCFVSTMIVSFRRETTVLCQKPQRTAELMLTALPSHKLLDKKSIGEKTLEKTMQALLIDIPRQVCRQVCDDLRLS